MFLNPEFIENPPAPLRVDLPTFQGPLDLLLYLIKKDEIDIYSIPIERITEGFLNHLALMQELNLEIAGEYIVMAATLLYLKSRSLLPKEQQAILEENEEEDPCWELIRQLLEYKKFKELSYKLGELRDKQSKVAWRGSDDRNLITKKVERLGDDAIFALFEAFQKILERFEKEEQRLIGDRFTVGEKIVWIRELLANGKRIAFSELFSDARDREELIVTFLAVLELVRLRQIQALQSTLFGEIELVGLSDGDEALPSGQ
ncbi:MAG: segregation/condensation protein A [Methylacidiphilales bacterium]|nr:segregation/condensation protein A [Candidatus Methylacidiphilales bacterium]MDW8348941.1 segregation/condensation protein A [Verrucomicrobiae bacterium]